MSGFYRRVFYLLSANRGFLNGEFLGLVRPMPAFGGVKEEIAGLSDKTGWAGRSHFETGNHLVVVFFQGFEQVFPVFAADTACQARRRVVVCLSVIVVDVQMDYSVGQLIDVSFEADIFV